MFKNQLNQNFNLAYESAQKLHKRKISKSEFASNYIFYIILPALAIGAISRKRMPKGKEWVLDQVHQVTGSLFLLGNLVNSATSGYWGGLTPLQGYVEDVQRVVSGKKPITKIRGFGKLVSKATGVPYVGLERLATGQLLGRMPKREEKKKLKRRTFKRKIERRTLKRRRLR